ncbi:hypothetical protein ACVWWN_003487 [Mycobacterium sp. URHB0021]
MGRNDEIRTEGVATLDSDGAQGSIDEAKLVCTKTANRSAVAWRSSTGSGDADTTGPNTTQVTFKAGGASMTNTITVADQLHLSRFAGNIIGCYRSSVV